MNILVTGGAGYIGSHTCITLIEAGYSVVVVDNFSNSNLGVIQAIEEITGKEIPFYVIDVTNKEELELVFKNNKMDGVIHFAGYKAVGESVIEPIKYYRNNLISTLNVADLCIKYSINKLVFSSSATVYGDNYSPLKEDMILLPTSNPYGETKAVCEKILSDVSLANNQIGIALLRYFNPVGAHESGLIGENPKGRPNNLMPYITRVAAGKLDKLDIFGNDYATIDGTGVRDFIHVSDLAKGHVAALQNISSGINVYNLGTGNGTSVLQLIRTFEKVNKLKIPFEFTERRSGDVAECYADVSKAQIDLKWKAEKTLEDMCKDAWNFERKFFSI